VGGLNLCAGIPIERYDALVPHAFRSETLLPGAVSALVIGSGGRALFDAFRNAPEAARLRDPVDTYTARVLAEAVHGLERAGQASRVVHALEHREGCFADLVALGRAAGLGWPSRLGLLLHPRFGPWMSLRAVVLSEADFAVGGELRVTAPCEGCPAPCATACPGAALPASGFDVSRCAETRRSLDRCRDRCAARRACTLGLDHAYSERAEAHHMTASLPAMALRSAP
jgi:epoxyqueuosine reductase QueG